MNKMLTVILTILCLPYFAKADTNHLNSDCYPTINSTHLFELIIKPALLNESAVVVVKYNRASGETWKKNKKAGWRLIDETSPLSPANYSVKYVEFDGKASLFRLNQLNGDTWVVDGNKWKPI